LPKGEVILIPSTSEKERGDPREGKILVTRLTSSPHRITLFYGYLMNARLLVKSPCQPRRHLWGFCMSVGLDIIQVL
jgi:hypothetical protein